MFSEITQPILNNFQSNYSPYDANVCNMWGVVKNPGCSKVMAFSNKYLLFLFSWERGFLMGSNVTECT